MSIEALWLVKFGDYLQPNQCENGGVIIFETQRAFGGDSGYAYVGNYQITDNKLTGTIIITQFDPDMQSVWGPQQIENAELNINLTIEDERMIGSMTLNNTGHCLPLFLVRFKDLP